jgi:hypothetical protein
LGGIQGFAAPLALPDAFPGPATGEAPTKRPGFLGQAVGGIHDSIEFWKETFDEEIYVENILCHGYKIPVKMSLEESCERYCEKNNKSPCNEAAYVR